MSEYKQHEHEYFSYDKKKPVILAFGLPNSFPSFHDVALGKLVRFRFCFFNCFILCLRFGIKMSSNIYAKDVIAKKK